MGVLTSFTRVLSHTEVPVVTDTKQTLSNCLLVLFLRIERCTVCRPRPELLVRGHKVLSREGRRSWTKSFNRSSKRLVHITRG